MNAPHGGRPSSPALADFIALNEEIAALVRARIPLEPHLSRMGKQMPRTAGELAQRIGSRLEAGQSLAAALDAECAVLPPTYRAVVVAGAESGHLGSALEAFVDAASRIDQMRRVTGVALLYPLVLFVVVCWLLALIVTAVVPSFESLGRYSFPPIAWLADWPLAGPVLIFGVPGVVVLLAAIWWWRSGPAGRASRMGLSARLPGSGRLQRWSQAAIFAEMLLLLVERGVPLDRSLRLAAEAIDDAKLRRAAERLAERSRAGVAVSQSPNDAESRAEFPLLIRLALYHANNRSLLAGGLRQAAATYRERAVRAANWYAEYLPILLTVVIGGTLTISFTFSILWPYVSMLHDLAGWKWR